MISGEVHRRRSCCISHHFSEAATGNSQKIAVIHAAPSSGCGGGPQLPRELIGGGGVGASSFSSSSPPVYEGDQFFTFGDVLKSVDSLSFRLRSILDGADDPHVIRPQSTSDDGKHEEQGTTYVLGPSTSFLPESKGAYKPKVLGIYMSPSVEYIISVLSVLRCGEAFLPLDPSWPKNRIFSTVSSSNADLVITLGSLFGEDDHNTLNKPNWLVECCSCPILCFSMQESLRNFVGPLHKVWPCKKEEQRLFCYLMYTSGSTGKPKGVCGTELGLLNRFLWMEELFPLNGDEVLLFKTSISFIDHLQEFLGAMLTSCTLVIPPFSKLKEYPFSLINFLQAYSINRLTAVPSLMRAVLPALQSQCNVQIQSSLKLLVLSGEVFPLSLWKVLSKLLPKTSILNLYGSTEVSGDCTYFDCKKLQMILETETLTTVPIGVPITNYDVVLGETDSSDEGEIYVGGCGVSNGYFSDSTVMSSSYVKMHKKSICDCPIDDCGSRAYYRTGDFARRLQCGDLVFLGRRDRTVKVNGQRIALEEIEDTLRGYPDVVDAAVISCEGPGELLRLEAFLFLKVKDKSIDLVRTSIRSWMAHKVPVAMIPNHFVFTESLPMSSSGKVDYALLSSSACSTMNVHDEIGSTETSDFLHVIKKEFCDALGVEEISNNSDFFMMGGNSIAAAHVSYNLGIDVRLLYNFPTPSKLFVALVGEKKSFGMGIRNDAHWKWDLKADGGNAFYAINSATFTLKSQELLLKSSHQKNDDHVAKRFKFNLDKCISSPKVVRSREEYSLSALVPMSCSFSRCNKVMNESDYGLSNTHEVIWSSEVLRNRKGFSMQELWKVHMESCVDASPLVVFKDQDAYLFIGSHSHKFICVNAESGSIHWEVKLEGRIECSAAIVGDFSQVVVGCYGGRIYFLDFSSGNICWTFQTCGEVKSQPVVDIRRQLIWCGSYDHNLYALDYRNRCCIYKFPCDGSIYGSPAIDEVRDRLYVASTSGHVTAISIKALPFYTLWQHELEVPLFGSLSVTCQNGNVICCLVDGNVVSLDLNGSIIWKHRTGGPVFAGACVSRGLHSQALICCRNGSVYSFEMEKGDLMWEYNVGDPMTASAYVDEHLMLLSDPSLPPDRLVCVCTSSGSIHLLRINLDVAGKANLPSDNVVQEFARWQLPGDIFSSPVMIGGRVFVGCRDDYVHCIAVETHSAVKE